MLHQQIARDHREHPGPDRCLVPAVSTRVDTLPRRVSTALMFQEGEVSRSLVLRGEDKGYVGAAIVGETLGDWGPRKS